MIKKIGNAKPVRRGEHAQIILTNCICDISLETTANHYKIQNPKKLVRLAKIS
jgi:hypothetical protein